MHQKKLFIGLSIVIGLTVLILVIFRNSIFKHKPNSNPPTLSKWACTNGNCKTSSTGTYKDEPSCRAGCITYQCDTANPGQCIQSPPGTVGKYLSLKVCQKACSPDRYTCDSQGGRGCIVTKDTGAGTYATLDLCNAQCRWNCSGGGDGTPGACNFCTSSTDCPYPSGNTLAACQTKCAQSCCGWKCVNKVCTYVTEGAEYSTEDACKSDCK